MTEPLESEYWRDQAACRDSYANIFYPEKDDYRTIREAKLICRGCPVSTECLDAALGNGEPFGIWGGYLPEEREIIRVANRLPLRKPPDIFPHGTAAGYARHSRAGERPCRSCIEGHSRERYEYKKRKDQGASDAS